MRERSCMAKIEIRALIAVALSVTLLMSLCFHQASFVSAATISEKGRVERIIVRYEALLPTARPTHETWAVPCLDPPYADRLERGRWIGARMQVIRITPPSRPAVARRIARYLERCPDIEWAEPDVVIFGTADRERG